MYICYMYMYICIYVYVYMYICIYIYIYIYIICRYVILIIYIHSTQRQEYDGNCVKRSDESTCFGWLNLSPGLRVCIHVQLKSLFSYFENSFSPIYKCIFQFMIVKG